MTLNFNEHLEIIPLVETKIIEETLSRIGIANKKKKEIFPTCYLLKKDDKYFIYHFKQLFQLLKKDAYSNLTEEDVIRRNAIIFCLKNWKLIDCKQEDLEPHNIFVFVLPYNDKQNWKIIHKFNKKLLSDNLSE
jgi:hypothetical protein